MLLSAKIIKNPRKRRRCEYCEKWIDGPQLYLYGSGENYDKPYGMYLHRECTQDPLIAKKLGEVNHEPT